MSDLNEQLKEQLRVREQLINEIEQLLADICELEHRLQASVDEMRGGREIVTRLQQLRNKMN